MGSGDPGRAQARSGLGQLFPPNPFPPSAQSPEWKRAMCDPELCAAGGREALQHRGPEAGSPSRQWPRLVRLFWLLSDLSRSWARPLSPGAYGSPHPFSDLSGAGSSRLWFPTTEPQPQLPSACLHTQTHSATVLRKRKHDSHPSGCVSKLCLPPRSSNSWLPKTFSPVHAVGFPTEDSLVPYYPGSSSRRAQHRKSVSPQSPRP